VAEEIKDANKEPVVEPSVDETMDKILDEHEASSASKAKEGKQEDAAPGADQDKKALPASDKEPDASTPEAKLAKIKEILGNDEKAVDAYIKSKGYHLDPAWQKLLEKSKTPVIDEATQAKLAEFTKVTSSREYIETKMKSEGYKQETINAELKKRGFDVADKGTDDVELVLSTLGIDPKSINDEARAIISDVSRVVDIILKDRLGKTLPERMKPIEDTITAIGRKENASKLVGQIHSIIDEEKVLDYKADIEPLLCEWAKEHPDAKQEDIFDYFLQINHQLSLERLRTGAKRADTQGKKDNLRTPAKPAVKISDIKKTGDFDTDADAILDALGAQ